MKLVAISDLHGNLIDIPQADLVVMTGDFSPLSIQCKYVDMIMWIDFQFLPWIKRLDCNKFGFIAGNHDFCCENPNFKQQFDKLVKSHQLDDKVIYLEQSEYEYNGLRIFGCPYSNISGWAFSTAQKPDAYRAIPHDVDILLIHQAPEIGAVGHSYPGTPLEQVWGSKELTAEIDLKNPRYVFCGHIHTGERHQKYQQTDIYNVSILDEDYKIAFEPLCIEI